MGHLIEIDCQVVMKMWEFSYDKLVGYLIFREMLISRIFKSSSLSLLGGVLTWPLMLRQEGHCVKSLAHVL